MTDRTPVEWLHDRLSEHFPLSDADNAKIAALNFSVRSFEPGQYLLREGDRPRVCSFLTSGFIYRHKIVGDGGRQIVSIHLPGDFVDMQQVLLAEADHNVQALTAVSVISVPTEEMVSTAMAHPAIARALWHEMLVEASIHREWLANVGRRDARARMAHLLCELAIRSEIAQLSPRENFELPMTQEQLGDALGLTAVHVNRTLKTLESEGLIVRNKRSVVIANWQRLRVAGDFSATYLHLRDTPREVPARTG